MISFLVLVTFLSAEAAPRLVRRDIQNHAYTSASNGVLVQTDAVKHATSQFSALTGQVADEMQLSQTTVVVFITGSNGHQLTGSDDGSLSFSDNWDETAQWRLIDVGEGAMKIQSVSEQSFLFANEKHRLFQNAGPGSWFLEAGPKGGVKLKSDRGKYLNSNSLQNIQDDDQTEAFVFKLALQEVAWGGGSTSILNACIVGPGGGLLKEERDSSIHLEGRVSEEAVMWKISAKGDGSVHIQGNNADFLYDNEGVLQMAKQNAKGSLHVRHMGWLLNYKQEGKMLVKSHLKANIREDDSVPSMAPEDPSGRRDRDVHKYSSSLFTFLIQSITF